MDIWNQTWTIPSCVHGNSPPCIPVDTVLGHARLLHFTLHMSAVHTSVCVCVGMYVCVHVWVCGWMCACVNVWWCIVFVSVHMHTGHMYSESLLLGLKFHQLYLTSNGEYFWNSPAQLLVSLLCMWCKVAGIICRPGPTSLHFKD